MEIGYTSFKKSGKFASGEYDNSITVPEELERKFKQTIVSQVDEFRFEFRQWLAEAIRAELLESGLAYAVVSEDGVMNPATGKASEDFEYLIGYPMMVVAEF